MIKLTEAQTLLMRLRSQRLDGRPAALTDSTAQAIEEVCGVQAQDLSAAGLSVRARSRGLTAGDVDRARLVERSIVWTWALRGTLHFIPAADFHWMIPLLGPRFIAGNRSRHRQLGLDEDSLEKGSRCIRQALEDLGPLTRGEIDDLLGAHGIQAEGQRLPHLIAFTVAEGTICHGPDKDGEPSFILVEDWIGRAQAWPRDAALAVLARRYLAAYAPAAPPDLAAWSGTGLADARSAMNQIADEIVQVEAAGREAWVLKNQLDWLGEFPAAKAGAPVVRLLPYFDTYLMGYASRELIVDPGYWKRINPGGGMLHPTLLVDGRLVGVWSKKQRRGTLLMTLEPFDSLDPDLYPLVEAEAGDVARFLGLSPSLQVAPVWSL